MPTSVTFVAMKMVGTAHPTECFSRMEAYVKSGACNSSFDVLDGRLIVKADVTKTSVIPPAEDFLKQGKQRIVLEGLLKIHLVLLLFHIAISLPTAHRRVP